MKIELNNLLYRYIALLGKGKNFDHIGKHIIFTKISIYSEVKEWYEKVKPDMVFSL